MSLNKIEYKELFNGDIMVIDITLNVTPEMMNAASNNLKLSLVGHIGTHFDVMDKEFPLEYTKRKGVIFDVSNIGDRDILISDIELNKVSKDMFVLFYSGFIEKDEYGTKNYFLNHPQLSNELIYELINREVSLIGIDFAGVRRGNEHTPMDQYCADNGVFIIENLCNLDKLLECENMMVNTYPMRFAEVTGLPCRVIVEV